MRDDGGGYLLIEEHSWLPLSIKKFSGYLV